MGNTLYLEWLIKKELLKKIWNDEIPCGDTRTIKKREPVWSNLNRLFT